MSAKAALAELTRGIRADLARCQALQPLLVEQQRLLARTDAEALQPLGEQIGDALAALEVSAGRRGEILVGLGLNADTGGFERLLTKLPPALATELRSLWRELEAALVRCQALNERNGELLASHRTALDDLLGTTTNPYDQLR